MLSGNLGKVRHGAARAVINSICSLTFLCGVAPDALGDARSNDSINANQVHAGGSLGLDLAGRGVLVGIWDGGPVRATHEMFAGPTLVRATAPEESSILSDDDHVFEASRVTIQQGSGFNSHATHVAGIIGGRSSNTNARGVAHEVRMLSFTSSNDVNEMASNAHRLDLSNHSYGLNLSSGSSTYGDYSSSSRAYDQIAYDNPHYLSVWSAGNDGSRGFDTLTGLGKMSKNTLTVGSITDHVTDPHNGNGITLSSFSSRGPTDDGRLSPQVVTNGQGVVSAGTGSDTSYTTLSGTSMAAPAATGAAALLIEHTLNLRGSKPLAATTKGLLMHTATDVTTGNLDPGPDYHTGYGLVNVAEGAQFLTDALSSPPVTQENFLYELNLGSGDETVFNFQVVDDEVKATLVWTDLPGATVSGANNRTPVLVNDLDLWAQSAGSTFFPWTLDVLNPGAPAVRNQRNNVDNVEQVFIDSLAIGSSLSFHVGHFGALTTGAQNYSLLISGVTMIPEPSALLLLAAAVSLASTTRRD